MIGESEIKENIEYNEFSLIYDNVWGTIYHAVKKQCDNTPTITGDGSRINPDHASELRWIAISQEMLYCEYRQRIINDNTNKSFKGKIQYGDTIWIKSPYDEINGWWVVRDAKNKRYTNSIDFLQTVGDGDLYGNNKLWNGRFDGIKIYKRNPLIINKT
jgi:hypothetical protein